MKTQNSIRIILALLACLLSGCRGKNCNKAANFTRDGQHTQITKIELCSNRKSYDRDDVVHIRFTLTNVWDQPLLLTDEVRPVVDVCTEGDGYGERCWSDEQGPSPPLTSLLLEPGDSYTIEWDWQSDGGGDVIIEGYWLRPDGIFGHVSILIVYGAGKALRPFDF